MALGNSKLLLNPATGLKPRSAGVNGGLRSPPQVALKKGNRTFGSMNFGDFVVTFRCKSSEFPGFFFCKLLTCKYLVRLEGIEPS